MKVMLPGVRGREAYAKILEKVKELREKYNIRFDRDAFDEYEAVYGVLCALEQIIDAKEEKKGRKKKPLVENVVIEYEGKKKEASPIDWEEIRAIVEEIKTMRGEVS